MNFSEIFALDSLRSQLITCWRVSPKRTPDDLPGISDRNFTDVFLFYILSRIPRVICVRIHTFTNYSKDFFRKCLQRFNRNLKSLQAFVQCVFYGISINTVHDYFKIYAKCFFVDFSMHLDDKAIHCNHHSLVYTLEEANFKFHYIHFLHFQHHRITKTQNLLLQITIMMRQNIGKIA